MWSFSIGRWLGIPVYLDWSFLLMLLIMAVVDARSLPLLIAFFTIILIHEFGHCFATLALGYPVYDITLYPIGGIARITIPRSGWKEVVISAAGPAMNVLLIPILWCLAIYQPVFSVLQFPNQIFLGFNLLPVFPLDGGRILRGTMTQLTGDFVKSTLVAARIGQISAVMMGFVSIYWGLWSLLPIALFIGWVASMEKRQLA